MNDKSCLITAALKAIYRSFCSGHPPTFPSPTRIHPNTHKERAPIKLARSLALGLVFALVAAAAAHAQAQPKQYLSVLTVHAKPDGALGYEAFIKKVLAASEKTDQNQRTLTYQVTQGGPGYTYMGR